MAQAVTLRGTKLLIKVGNGADPEVFTHDCSINGQRSVQVQAQTNDVNVPDCDDPDLMAWIQREKISVSVDVSGEGVLNTPDSLSWINWAGSSDPKNCLLVLDAPGADGGIIGAGSFHCTQSQFSGNRGEKVQLSIQLQSTGEVTWTANS